MHVRFSGAIPNAPVPLGISIAVLLRWLFAKRLGLRWPLGPVRAEICVSKNFKLLQKLWVLSDVEWRRVTLSDVAWRWVTLMSSDRSDPGVTLNERLYAGIDFPWPRQGLWRDDILGELWGTDDMFSMILIRWLKIKEVWSLKVLLYEVQTCQCSSWTPRALKRSLPRAPHTWTGQRPELGISMESRLWRKTSENTTVIYWYIIYTLIIYICNIYWLYIVILDEATNIEKLVTYFLKSGVKPYQVRSPVHTAIRQEMAGATGDTWRKSGWHHHALRGTEGHILRFGGH